MVGLLGLTRSRALGRSGAFDGFRTFVGLQELSRRKAVSQDRKTVTPVARQDAGESVQPEVQISEELLKANEGSEAVEGAAPAKRPAPRKSK